jgi:hypothetical protein
MPNTFPDVPFDESLFEANELMREYWNRSTENRSVSMVKDSNVEEPFMPMELLELHEVSKKLYENSIANEVAKTTHEETVEDLHVVDEVVPSVPTHEAIVKTLTVSTGSSMSAGTVIAIIIITILVLYLLIVAVVPRFTGSMRD